MKKTQLTKEGFRQLQLELEELRTKKQPMAVSRLQKARAMGDLSENSEYSAAKEEVSFIDGRVREIEEILKNVEVVENKTNDDSICIGSKVTVTVNGSQEKFFLVGEFEADPLNKKLSITSPIGSALMGKKVGDSVLVNIPAGTVNYKIVAID
ncbi:transcription elongation factor GreA [Candidatus Roizmanbacteria bacterium]|nr:transcription elongation factor GreA [Candidatus Roizmanbacteria bacterium]